MSVDNFYWLNDESRKFLANGYLTEGVSPEQRVRNIADHAEKLTGIAGFSDRVFDVVAKGYMSLSSPIWSNYGTDRGLPVSCYGSSVEDSVAGILDTVSEVGVMSKLGGGTSGYMGNIRSRGSAIQGNPDDKTSGSVHFMELFSKVTEIVSQGNTRRGRFSPYLPVEHPDILEFLRIGYEESLIQNMTHAVTVTDEWLDDMKAGDSEKRHIWAKVLQARRDNGYPYIMFVDNVDQVKADVYRNKKIPIKNSNLCSEILLPTSDTESFVCVLSSMNLYNYDLWKDTDAVETAIIFLDSVVTEFIDKLDGLDAVTRYAMRKARAFAENHRALGLGAMGWHSYLQKNMVAFESKEAAQLNYRIFKDIRAKADAASRKLADMFGECPMTEGYGRRNTTLMSIAPTTSSAAILGQVSPSIEPIFSNCFVSDLAKSKEVWRNPELQARLAAMGMDTREVWKSIADNDGSVEHLDFLTDHQKEVFRPFKDISPATVLYQAAARQEFLDQTQSLNLMIDPRFSAKDINKITLLAHELGIPTLYYQRGKSSAQEFARMKNLSCAACEA